MASIRETLENGLAHHQADRFDDAKSCYQAALEQEPDNIDAMHLLGVILSDTGNRKTLFR